jgi:stringent starvation protein B
MLMNNTPDATSTRPYLIRALYEWCTDNGLTPYLAVSVNEGVQVPLEFVQNGEIVLNVGLDATSSLKLGNDFIEFKARFSGTAREIMVPVSQVMAIYARENGQGMSFPVLPPQALSEKSPLVRVAALDAELAPPASPNGKPVQLSRVKKNAPQAEGDETPPPSRSPPTAGRPALKRVK